MTEVLRVGFAGIGRMGRPQAANIAKAGFPLTVWNRTRAKAEELAAEVGATVVDRPADLAGCDVIITMMADGPATESVYEGPDGILAARTTLRLRVLVVEANRIIDLDRRGVPWRKFFFVNREYREFDASRVEAYGYGRLPDVITSFELEQMLRQGRVLTREGKVPRCVALIHCVGSRSAEYHYQEGINDVQRAGGKAGLRAGGEGVAGYVGDAAGDRELDHHERPRRDPDRAAVAAIPAEAGERALSPPRRPNRSRSLTAGCRARSTTRSSPSSSPHSSQPRRA